VESVRPPLTVGRRLDLQLAMCSADASPVIVRQNVVRRWVVLGDCLQNGSPCTIGLRSCLSVLSVLSVTSVYCGQTVGWIKTKLGTEVGLGPGHIVLNGDPAHQENGHSTPQFSAHVCGSQTAEWIKMPLGRDVDLGPGDIVLERAQYPHFSAHVYCDQTAV